MKEDVLFDIVLNASSISISDIVNKCMNEPLVYWEIEQILSAYDRKKRFELFIALNDSVLHNDKFLAFKAFREAYCSSDNIYEKIKSSPICFDLKSFIKNVDNKNGGVKSTMNPTEEKFYDELKNCFTIYRGISVTEHESKDYGVSWSLSKKEAENYLNFSANNINGEGGILSKSINKEDVITIFSVCETLNGDAKNEIIYINHGEQPTFEKINN